MAERTHMLKTWPTYFDAVECGDKTFEVRRDDRGFQKGDALRLLRWDPDVRSYSVAKGHVYDNRLQDFTDNPSWARAVTRRVTWILTGGQHGVEPGYVVMGLAPIEAAARSSEGGT